MKNLFILGIALIFIQGCTNRKTAIDYKSQSPQTEEEWRQSEEEWRQSEEDWRQSEEDWKQSEQNKK